VRRLENLLGRSGALLVFVRSVHWCGYCRNQLAELINVAPRLAQAGVALVTVSPDPVERLRDFADAYGVPYVMLSDERGELIRAFGMLNGNIPPGDPVQGDNIPFPGHFLLAPDRVILDKLISDDLRHRPSGTVLASRHGAISEPSRVLVADQACTIRASLSTATVYGGQEIGIRFEVALEPGWHVYGRDAVFPFVPFQVDFGGCDLVECFELRLPEPGWITFPALGESAPVHGGTFAAMGTVRLRWRPVASIDAIVGIDELKSLRTAPGPATLHAVLRYQICSSDICRPPSEIPVQFPILLEDDVPTASGSTVPWRDLVQ
jgi:peroxiredoxin